MYREADTEVAAPLELGTPRDGVLDWAQSSATFAVGLTEGHTYRVRVSSTNGNPGVAIIAPGESPRDAWTADDSGVGALPTDVDEPFTADVSGTYSLEAVRYTCTTMSYRVQVDEVRNTDDASK